jgi:hypothetical protein
MTRMAGEPLLDGHTTMCQERSLLAADLKHSLDQLCSLAAPSSGPSICGIGFRCLRIESDHIGPFDTEPNFYCYL